MQGYTVLQAVRRFVRLILTCSVIGVLGCDNHSVESLQVHAGKSSKALTDTDSDVESGADSASEATEAEILEFTIPSGTRFEDAAIAASESIRLADGISAADSSAYVYCDGTGLTEIGADAVVQGSVLTNGDMLLRDRTHIYGDARAEGTIETHSDVVVDGVTEQNTQISKDPPYTWEIVFPDMEEGVNLEPDLEMDLAPGAYDFLTLKSRSTIRLTAGTYFFNRFITEPEGTIEVNGGGDPVTVYVRDELTSRAEFVHSTSSKDFLMGYAGEAKVDLDGPFSGTVVAPNAEIRLAPLNGGSHEGQFFCRRFEAEARTPINFVPYDNWELLVDRSVNFDLVSLDPAPTGHVGGLSGSSEVTADGAFTYELPLDVPDGRQGMSPSLALTYNSRGGQGPLGMGWSLSGLSAVKRCDQNLSMDAITDGIDFDSTDRFCLDGQRLVLISGEYGEPDSEYVTRRDTYRRIKAFGQDEEIEYFRVYTADGLVQIYGDYGASHSENANIRGERVSASSVDKLGEGELRSLGEVVYGWSLSKVADRRGNSYRYTYELDSGDDESLPGVEQRIKEIAYTYLDGHEDRYPAQRKITFTWVPRADSSFAYKSGFAMRSENILKTIKMYAPGVDGESDTSAVWSYQLFYDQGPTTGRDRLYRVMKCAPGISNCDLTAEFEWSDGIPLDDPDAFRQVETDVKWHDNYDDDPLTVDSEPLTIRYADFNGDGVIDVMWSDPEIGLSSVRLGQLTSTSGGEPSISFGSDLFLNSSSNEYLHSISFQGVRPVDLEQDGQDELLMTYHKYTLLQWVGGDGLFEKMDNQPDFPGWADVVYLKPGTVNPGTAGALFIDLDGNGYLDMLFETDTYEEGEWAASFGDGNGFDSDFVGTGLVNKSFARSFMRAADLNGDGRGEFILPGPYNNTYYLEVGLDDSGDVNATRVNFDFEWDYLSWEWPDINGDGLIDGWIFEWYDSDSPPNLRRNTGLGFGPSEPAAKGYDDAIGIVPLKSISGHFYPPAGLRTADLNLDGRDDLVFPYCEGGGYTTGNSGCARDRYFQTFVSTGNDLRPLALQGDMYNWWESVWWKAGLASVRAFDVNGDGLDDLLFPAGDYLRVLFRKGGTPDLMTGVTDGNRRRQEIEYEPISNSEVHTPLEDCEFPERCLRGGLTVVHKHWVDTGRLSSMRELDYHYEGARANTQGLGFVGFARRRIKDVERGETTIETYDNTARQLILAPVLVPDEEYFYETSPRTVTRFGSDDYGNFHLLHTDNTVSVDDTYHGLSPFGNFSFQVNLTQRSINEYDGESISVAQMCGEDYFKEPCYEEYGSGIRDYPDLTFRRGTDILYTYAPHGLVESVEQETIGSLNIAPTFSVGQQSTVNVTYEEIDEWLYVPTARIESSTAEAETATRTVHYDYDVYGFLTQETREPNPDPADTATYLLTRYVRNPDLGVVERVEHETYDNADPSRVTEYTYDSEGLYVETVTNALGHVTRIYTHPSFGLPARVEDPNGVWQNYRYDAYGRLRLFEAPDRPDIGINYQWADPSYTYTPLTIVETHEDGYNIETEYDRLGRPLITDEAGFDGRRVITRHGFDALGRLSFTARPRFDGDTLYATRYEYDTLDRPRSVSVPAESPDDPAATEAVSEFDYAYSVYHIAVDPEGGKRTYRTDPDGRVRMLDEEIATGEHNVDGSIYRTYMSYAPFGLLSYIMADFGDRNITTTLTYDRRGRIKTVNSQDIGEREIIYNGFGEVIEERNLATSATTTYERDALGRVTRRVFDDGASTRETTYAWDLDNEGEGKLGRLRETVASDGAVRTVFRYDRFARPTQIEQEIDGRTYLVDYDYDSLGRPRRLHYPEISGQPRLTLRYDYDSSTGFLQGLQSEGLTSAVEWSVTNRDARGFLTGETFGEETSTRTFYPQSGRLATIEVLGPSDELLYEMNYSYDLKGQVRYRRDCRRENDELCFTDEFRYDDIGRLIWWGKTGETDPLSWSYSYDELGNLRSAAFTDGSGTNTYAYEYGEKGAPDNAGPCAVVSAGSVTYGYDAERRISSRDTPDGMTSFEYTAFDLPIRIDHSTQGRVDFLYDGSDRRVRKSAEHGRTVDYVTDLMERREGEGGVEYVFFVREGKRTIAQVNVEGEAGSPEVEYIHDDHLGSVGVVTDGEGAVQSDHFYNPWGLRLEQDGTTGDNAIYNGAANPSAAITRGFTGHEHDDALGVINMRGRIYDPHSIHFLSPDPAVLAQLSSLNPMADTSPEIQNAGPWPHGKTSSGAERFSAGISESRYTPPGLKAGPTSVSEISSNRLPDVIGGESGLASNAAGSTWTNIDDSPTSQSLNPYSYVLNNPLRYTDPTGFVVDTVVDAGFILWDIGSMIYHAVQGDWDGVKTDAIALGADVACALAPGATGGGPAVRAAREGAEQVMLHAGTKRTTQAAVKAQQTAKAEGKVGRGGHKLKPDPKATGPHSTFKTDPQTGKVTGHAEWKPNPQSSSGFEQVKRVDVTGGPHFNKVTGKRVSTPHTHGKNIPGEVRPAKQNEVPRCIDDELP